MYLRPCTRAFAEPTYTPPYYFVVPAYTCGECTESVAFAGQVLDEERRVVVRGDPVGDPALGQVATVRRDDGPPGGGEPVAHARGRRPFRVPAAAGVQPRHLRPDARVLEASGVGPAHVPGDTPVPAAQELGLRSRGRVVMTVERRRRRRQTSRARQRLAVRPPGKRVVSTSSPVTKRYQHDRSVIVVSAVHHGGTNSGA